MGGGGGDPYHGGGGGGGGNTGHGTIYIYNNFHVPGSKRLILGINSSHL